MSPRAIAPSLESGPKRSAASTETDPLTHFCNWPTSRTDPDTCRHFSPSDLASRKPPLTSVDLFRQHKTVATDPDFGPHFYWEEITPSEPTAIASTFWITERSAPFTKTDPLTHFCNWSRCLPSTQPYRFGLPKNPISLRQLVCGSAKHKNASSTGKNERKKKKMNFIVHCKHNSIITILINNESFALDALPVGR